MRDAGLEEFGPLDSKSDALPEADRALLRVDVDDLILRRRAEHVPHQRRAHGAPALLAHDRYTLDLPAARRDARPGGVDGLLTPFRQLTAHQEVTALVVEAVELELDGYALLFHEHGVANGARESALRLGLGGPYTQLHVGEGSCAERWGASREGTAPNLYLRGCISTEDSV